MVYIITNNFCNFSSSLIEWLNYYNITNIRINDYVCDFYKINFKLNASLNKKFKVNQNFYFVHKPSGGDYIENEDLSNQIKFEYYQGFFKLLDDNRTLGQLDFTSGNSKINILKVVNRFNIKFPDSLITNSKNDLIRFHSIHDNIVTKPIHEIFDYRSMGKLYRPYTAIVTHEDINCAPTFFGISLFQKNIFKYCDIKSFYIDGDFYSQAIFSQHNENTSVDFRLYETNNMNRTSPFKLPNNLEIKMRKVLNYLKIKMAVVDFILDTKNEIYFLEINIEGIFENISIDCNYNLDKIISNHIKKKL
jgi:hypothetical protein